MGVQISCCVHSQVPQKTLYGQLRPHLADVFRKLALQKESRVEEGPPYAGSRSHDDFGSTKIRGLAGGRIYQEQRARSIWPVA